MHTFITKTFLPLAQARRQMRDRHVKLLLRPFKYEEHELIHKLKEFLDDVLKSVCESVSAGSDRLAVQAARRHAMQAMTHAAGLPPRLVSSRLG